MWPGPRHDKCHLDPSSRLDNRHGPKIGEGSTPFLGRGLRPHLTQSPWDEAYLHTKWHLDASSRLATIEMGQKIGEELRPLFGEGAGSPSNTKSTGLRTTSMPSATLIHPAVWPQKNMGPKFGSVPFWGRREQGAGSPSNTKSSELKPTSIPSGVLIHPAIWPQQICAENWGLCPYGGRGGGSPSNTMWPGPRPTSMPSFILIHPTV